jgi:hypothetical protein
MANTLTCPNCGTEIQITQALESQLSSQIRAQLDAEFQQRCLSLQAKSNELASQQQSIEAARTSIGAQVAAGIAAQRDQLLAEAARKAKNDLAVELNDRDALVKELQGKLKEAQTNELELRRRERALESKSAELELAAARQVDAERQQIRNDARWQSEQEHQMKDAEKELQIAGLRKQIDELKRMAEQGSQQVQGEVQELALEDMLTAAFPTDSIDPVPQGVTGGDTLQRVIGAGGLCGAILWESKRTKNWSDGWLPKLRNDQREAKAACAVIVSEALPQNVRTFALIDGVWVCSWTCVVGLAAALRVGLIEVAKNRLATVGQNEKMELVYGYLASRDFRNRVTGIVEAFVTMHSDLESERRSIQRLWSKREKQIQRAVINTAGLYGDLQGIVGASLPEIDGLTLQHLACDEADGQPVSQPLLS